MKHLTAFIKLFFNINLVKIIYLKHRNLTSTVEMKKRPEPRFFSARALITFKDNSLLYTPIPKCGWSTWTSVLYENAKVNKTQLENAK